ncbi:MAG: type II toxin-antitoxin system HicB family antitoxin [Pirellulales bacterium]|nr:type II toxin-antitoxin system HicB family antitoxin [Pirellulales bacterium]
MPEEDGYSVWIPDLPGVASQGDTMEEAIGNLKEAFRGAISVYRESGDSIPWTTEIEEKAADVVERWILIDA